MDLQCTLGIQCSDFVMLAADQSEMMSVLVLKDDCQKIVSLSPQLLMAAIGEASDREQFGKYVQKNLALYRIRNGYHLSASASAQYIRNTLAEGIRSGNHYKVNMLLGGCDEDTCQLYYMDYLGSMIRLPYAAHGFGGMLSLSILGTYYKPSLSIQEAYDVMCRCVAEVHKRLIINLPNFSVSAISPSGLTTLPPIHVTAMHT